MANSQESKFSLGIVFLNQIADVFGLSNNVCSVRLCAEVGSAVTLEVEEYVTNEQTKELMPILRRYRLVEVEPKVTPSGDAEVTTHGDRSKGLRRLVNLKTGYVHFEKIEPEPNDQPA